MTLFQKLTDAATAFVLAGLLFVLGALALSSSCAHPAPAIVVAGRSLITTDRLFRATAAIFYGQCSRWDIPNPVPAPLFNVATCVAFADFADTYLKAEKLAAAGYDAAAAGAADGGAYDVDALLLQLETFGQVAASVGLTPTPTTPGSP